MELYQNPVSLRVADFIGNPRINFVEAKANKTNAELMANSDIGQMSFPKLLWTEDMPNENEFDCVLGIRPEKLTVSTAEIHDSIRASIYSVQPAGSETIIHVIAGKTSLLIRDMGIKSYKMDQPVWLNTDLSKIIIFSKKSGRLIKKAVPD